MPTTSTKQNTSATYSLKRNTLLVTLGILCIPSLFTDMIAWRGSIQLHTLMEVVATLLALMIGISALVRYFAKPNERLLLYVGAAFIGTGFLDGYHAVVTAEFFSLHFPSPNETLIPWSWAASRLYLSLFFAWAWYRLMARFKHKKMNSASVLLIMLTTTLLCFFIFAFVPLPKAYYSELLVHRPGEIIPAILFSIALYGFVKRGRWQQDDFEFWILMFLVVSIVSQLVYMPFSQALFDYQFDFAHLLKKLSYVAVLTGVFVSMLQSFRSEEKAILDIEDLTLTQKSLEERVAEQDARVRLFSDAIQQSSEAVAITDNNGVIQYTNRAFSELTGYSASEALGKTPGVLNSGFHDSDFYENLWATIKSGESWQHRIVNRRKDKSLFPSLLAISPIKNDEGEITNFVGIQQDLTSYETLEQQFQQSQKMEAIGTLVGGIAHDFNNTLAGIVGNVFLLKQKVSDKDAIKRIDTINDLSMRAAEMIRKLLAFARKDTKKMNTVKVSSFLKEVIKLVSVSIPENIRFIDNVASQDIHIMGDINLLQQVFINLINNSRDAVADNTGEKMISIDLNLVPPNETIVKNHPELDAETFACIEITDNGCGIPIDELARIFEPFYTTKDVDKGTGLGLAMSYGAIKSHRGVIDVESQLNIGTTFRVFLPAIGEDKIISMPSTTDELLQGQGETILLVDDEYSITETGRSVLESIGYKVMVANNGSEAVKIYSEHHKRIDIIITDVVMPVKTGIEAAVDFRRINPNVPIIFATGYQPESESKIDSNLSNELVLVKPFSAISLSHKVTEGLKNR